MRSALRASTVPLSVTLTLGCLLLLPFGGAAAEPRPIGVVDLHVDLSYQLNYKAAALARGSGQYLAEHLTQSGVAGVVLPLYVPHEVHENGPRLDDFEKSYAKLVAAIRESEPYALPGCPRSGGIRTWLSFEGSAPFATAPERIRGWVLRGAKLFGLVHVRDNALASSAGAQPKIVKHTQGLTQKGQEFVRTVAAQGGIIDVSHASDETFKDVFEWALLERVPMLATHSNARALAEHARNLSDDQLRSIARTGGVIGVNFHRAFLTREPRPATLADVVKQIRHIAMVVGVKHVAIGSDMEGGISPPAALADVRGFPRLAAALAEAGFSRHDVELIFGLNALRLLCRAPDAGLDSRCQVR